MTVELFSTVLADPPWDFKVYSKKGTGRSACQHYSTLDLEAIKALPVKEVCAKDCTLLLWGTWPMLEGVLAVMKSWGFTYKTGFPWLKQTKDGSRLRMGTGYHIRSCSEYVFIGRRGKPKAPIPSKRPIGAIVSVQGAHSAKPFEMYRRAEAYAGPYLELFARPCTYDPHLMHWTRLGNEIDGQDIRDALPALAARLRAEAALQNEMYDASQRLLQGGAQGRMASAAQEIIDTIESEAA